MFRYQRHSKPPNTNWYANRNIFDKISAAICMYRVEFLETNTRFVISHPKNPRIQMFNPMR